MFSGHRTTGVALHEPQALVGRVRVGAVVGVFRVYYSDCFCCAPPPSLFEAARAYRATILRAVWTPKV